MQIAQLVTSHRIMSFEKFGCKGNEGNSEFCGPETAVVARSEAEGNNGGLGATKLTVFPRSQ